MATPVFKRDGSGQLNGSIGDGRDRVPTSAYHVGPGQAVDECPGTRFMDVVDVLREVSPTMVRVVEVRDRGKDDFTRCAHCGTSIRYEAEVELSDGSHAVWGTSCAGLSPSERDHSLTRQQARASRKAIEEWIATQPDLAAAVQAYDAYVEHVHMVVSQMETDNIAPGLQDVVLERINLPAPVEQAVSSIRSYGPDAWDRHRQALLDAHAAGILDARPGVGDLPTHVGSLGQKLTVDVVVHRKVLLQPYCYGASSPALVIAHDDTGNPVLTKTTSAWAYHVQPGQVMTWTGTVKEHSYRFDVPQTWLTRVKPR